jgi:hypothetical protein
LKKKEVKRMVSEVFEDNGVVKVSYVANTVRFLLSKESRLGLEYRCLLKGVDPNDIEVYLSRYGDRCPTPILSMDAHDSHAPGFYDTEEKNVYIQRVINDVQEAVNTLVSMTSHDVEIPNCSHCDGKHESDDCNWCENCWGHGTHITEDCDVYCNICDNWGHLEDSCEYYWCDNCDDNTHDTEDCEETDEENYELSLDEEVEADDADSEFMEIVSDTRP